MLTFKRFAVTTALAVSIAVPGQAAAQSQDLRNADQRAPVPAGPQDLRNADQRFADPVATQDLRNADRRAPGPVSSGPAPEITTFEVAGDGFDWSDAGIGAAGGIAVLVLAGGLATVATQRRRGTRLPA